MWGNYIIDYKRVLMQRYYFAQPLFLLLETRRVGGDLEEILGYILGGIFATAFLIDLLGHKYLKLKRNLYGWIVAGVVGTMAIACTFIGFRESIEEGKSQERSLYLAYHYLMDNDTENALKVLDEKVLGSGQGDIIKLLADYMNKDYMSVYFKSEQVLEINTLKKELQDRVEIINALAKQELGIEEVKMEASIEEQIITCYELLKIKEKDSIKYNDLYILDQDIRAGHIDEDTENKVRNLLAYYEDDEEILQMVIKYKVAAKDYKEAKRYAEKLLEQSACIENNIIYTDIIVQGTLDGDFLVEAEDKEAQILEKKVSELEEKIANGRVSEEKKEELLNQINELSKETKQLNIKRAINYLKAKQPIFFDNNGLYDVQLAKLYLAIDEREEAKKLIYKVIDKGNLISDESPIKETLMKVIDTYNQSEADRPSPLLKSAVHDLVSAESQGIIDVKDGNINGVLANYITSTLKYDKVGIHIGKIDTSQYPNIKAYVNINGTKEGKFNLASEFGKKDFEMIDTQYGISDFEIISDGSDAGSNIMIVMDASGSMNETPIMDSKIAAKACIDNMDTRSQSIGIVSYNENANVVVPITNSKESLINGVDSISSNGGTNISGAIKVGIQEVRNSSGTRAIILMSDGRDGNSYEAMEEAVAEAISNNVVIFAVGLGDVESDYMSYIAESTGGKFLMADNSTELEDIYRMLQKYIVNNYCFSYTVSKNPQIDPRNLMINLLPYQTFSDKNYSITDGIIEDEEYDDITLIDENTLTISSVTPNGLAVSDVQEGVIVSITGTGFKEGMNLSIGELQLKDVVIESKTSLKATLKGNLGAGSYPLKATLEDGRVSIKKDVINVFRAGTTTSVRIGEHTITADVIGRVGDRSFIASGNVMINGFIHSNAPITITAYKLPEDLEIKVNETAYLGDAGALSGNSKLYISYKQASENGKLSRAFANMVMGGKDYVLQNGEFAIGINGEDSDFDLALHNFDIQIPNMATVEIGDCKLYADRIEVNVKEINPVKIINSIKEGLSEGIESTQQEVDAVEAIYAGESREGAFKYSFKKTEGAITIALTASNIEFGFEVTLGVNEAIQFGIFELDEVKLKLNSLDEDNEYWAFGGKVNFAEIVKTMEGLEGSISSYYWCPDKINIKASLEQGIPIYNALYIDTIGLQLEGMSKIFQNASWISNDVKKILFANKDLDEVEVKDIMLAGLVEAQANLFKSFKLKVPHDMKEWGKLGAIKDGVIGLNLSQKEFSVSADLEILQQKLASAKIDFNRKKLNIEAEGQVQLSLLNCTIGGKLNFGIKTTWEVLNTVIGVEGNIDCGFVNFHANGKGELNFTAEYDGSYFAVELKQGNLVSKFWYDNDGTPVLWDRFHTTAYFD